MMSPRISIGRIKPVESWQGNGGRANDGKDADARQAGLRQTNEESAGSEVSPSPSI